MKNEKKTVDLKQEIPVEVPPVLHQDIGREVFRDRKGNEAQMVTLVPQPVDL